MSLQDIHTLVGDKLRSVAAGRELASPLYIERAVQQAVLQYGIDAPREVATDVDSVTGSEFDVPAQWVVGRSLLLAVEYPIGQAPMATVDAAVARVAGGQWRVLLATGLAAATVRVHFTAPHTASDTESTIPAEHENAVACWATAELCRQAATQFGHDRDATIGAAVSSGQSQSGDMARRARDWLAEYRHALGLPDPERAQASGGQGACAVTSWGHRRTRGRLASSGAL